MEIAKQDPGLLTRLFFLARARLRQDRSFSFCRKLRLLLVLLAAAGNTSNLASALTAKLLAGAGDILAAGFRYPENKHRLGSEGQVGTEPAAHFAARLAAVSRLFAGATQAGNGWPHSGYGGWTAGETAAQGHGDSAYFPGGSLGGSGGFGSGSLGGSAGFANGSFGGGGPWHGALGGGLPGQNSLPGPGGILGGLTGQDAADSPRGVEAIQETIQEAMQEAAEEAKTTVPDIATLLPPDGQARLPGSLEDLLEGLDDIVADAAAPGKEAPIETPDVPLAFVPESPGIPALPQLDASDIIAQQQVGEVPEPATLALLAAALVSLACCQRIRLRPARIRPTRPGSSASPGMDRHDARC